MGTASTEARPSQSAAPALNSKAVAGIAPAVQPVAPSIDRSAARDAPPHRLAYVLAASHSGSTLLSMLLGAHPVVRTVGELKFTALGDVEQYRCSCGARIRECAFWRRISQEMEARGHRFDVTDARTDLLKNASDYERRLLAPLHRGPWLEGLRDAALGLSPSWKRRLPEWERRNAALVASLKAATGATVIVDSSKTALRAKYLCRNPEIDLFVIHLVRDGRAVMLTYMDPAHYADAQDAEQRGGGSGASRDAERLSAVAAREWRRSCEEAEQLLRGLRRSRWTSVRYEELCADPRAVLGRLCAHLGVDPNAVNLSFRNLGQHVVGNGMRLDQSSEIRADDRWRRQLTANDLAAFESEAGALNRRYGYA